MRVWSDTDQIYYGLFIKHFEFFPNFNAAPRVWMKNKCTKKESTGKFKQIKDTVRSNPLFWVYNSTENTNYSEGWPVMARAKLVSPYRLKFS